MISLRLGSQITISASKPGAMDPFLGYSPYIFAWFVEVSATNSFKVMRPSTTPFEKRICKRVSTPGIPFGTQRNDASAFGLNFPWTLPYVKGQWSDEKVWNTPVRIPSHMASQLASSRGGGEQTYLPPVSSILRPFRSFAVSATDWGQVSPQRL